MYRLFPAPFTLVGQILVLLLSWFTLRSTDKSFPVAPVMIGIAFAYIPYALYFNRLCILILFLLFTAFLSGGIETCISTRPVSFKEVMLGLLYGVVLSVVIY
jgi:hypothetical protein